MSIKTLKESLDAIEAESSVITEGVEQLNEGVIQKVAAALALMAAAGGANAGSIDWTELATKVAATSKEAAVAIADATAKGINHAAPHVKDALQKGGSVAIKTAGELGSSAADGAVTLSRKSAGVGAIEGGLIDAGRFVGIGKSRFEEFFSNMGTAGGKLVQAANASFKKFTDESVINQLKEKTGRSDLTIEECEQAMAKAVDIVNKQVESGTGAFRSIAVGKNADGTADYSGNVVKLITTYTSSIEDTLIKVLKAGK